MKYNETCNIQSYQYGISDKIYIHVESKKYYIYLLYIQFVITAYITTNILFYCIGTNYIVFIYKYYL